MRVLLVLLVLSVEVRAEARYVFLFIGDGMGLAQVELAAGVLAGRGAQWPGDRCSVRGFVRTASHDSLVTDSAAAGTALASGLRTANGIIGQDPTGEPAPLSLLRIAGAAGRRVGLISSVTIDHATPAAFYASVSNRRDYATIAAQLPTASCQFIGGGGLLGGASALEPLISSGMRLVRGRAALLADPADGTPIYALGAADDAPLPWAIDRQEDQADLADLTRSAIDRLAGAEGCFLMIEGGKIDWAGHANDPGSLLHETLDFAAAIDIALDFAEARPAQTLIVITADHETGGLALGTRNSGYAWYPDLLLRQRSSGEALEAVLAEAPELAAAMPLIEQALGLWVDTGVALPAGPARDPRLQLSDQEFAALRRVQGDPAQLATLALRLFSERCGLGWTTGGHTGIAVPLWAQGLGSERFAGTYHLTGVHERMRAAMGL